MCRVLRRAHDGDDAPPGSGAPLAACISIGACDKAARRANALEFELQAEIGVSHFGVESRRA
jgi:hypothetical protein